MGNPCGTVHMPNFPCRECDRVRRRDAANEQKVVDDGVAAKVSSPEVSGPEDSAPVAVPAQRDKPDVSPSSKPDRLAVAAEALERYRAKNAARQKRYRERRKRRGE